MKDDRGSYNKRDLAKLNWTTGLEYQTIWFMFCKTFASLTDNAELVSYNSLNHQYIKQDYASFLLANDGDLFVKTYPTMNAFIISSEGTEFCYVTDGDGSGLRIRRASGSSYFTGCGNGNYAITYNGTPVSDYTYEVSNPSYGNVRKNSDGTLSLNASKENSTGSYITLHYKGETFTFQWHRPSAK